MEPKPYTCTIILRGPLNEHWADYLGDFSVEARGENGRILCSILTGFPADLPAFIGVLGSLNALGMTVLQADLTSTTLQPPDIS